MFQNAIKINTFSWSKIVKISFKRKQFFIQLRKELTESYDTLLGFNLANYRSCKNLWKSAVEHHSFFRLHAPPHSVQQRGRSMTPPSSNGAKKFLTLSLGSKFRYRYVKKDWHSFWHISNAYKQRFSGLVEFSKNLSNMTSPQPATKQHTKIY